MTRVLFAVSLFLSAILLFSIQPMVAKALLPVYGGTPAVWTVCMLFFQLVLLISYGYVWLLSFIKNTFLWRLLHVVLLACSLTALPVLFQPTSMNIRPEWGILYSLIIQTGGPLLIIGASAPLLQFAYSQTKGTGARDPYFLYIASNLGSLLALLAYPWLIEYFTGLNQQFYLWSMAYWGYAGLLLLVFLFFRYKPLESLEKTGATCSGRDIMYWICLSFIPCSLMLGVTLYITTDVAATPLFWVLPLALYLLSFVITFSSKPLISHAWAQRNYLFFLVFTIMGFIFGANQLMAWQLVMFNLSSFFILAVLCHGQLFQRRPEPQLLTLFYFCLAIGGVLAGLFNGIVAPHLFNQVYEYPLSILLSLLILPARESGRGLWVTLTLLALATILSCFIYMTGQSLYQWISVAALGFIVSSRQSKLHLFLSMSILFGLIFIPAFKEKHILLQERNFYGVKQVVGYQDAHGLISQSTVHGIQFMDKPPTGMESYYAPVNNIVVAMAKQAPTMSATLIGLGAGTTLCQFRNTDHVNVIEIDQQVMDIAKSPRLFTYLRDCPPHMEIFENDGRLELKNMADASQQLLILDAFNSDAIPTHLLTIEAFKLYRKKITQDGCIVVNLSNRHLELLPLLNAAGSLLNLQVYSINDRGNLKAGQFPSKWAVLTANQRLLAKLKSSDWQLSDDKAPQFLWTDDYSNIVPLLRWM